MKCVFFNTQTTGLLEYDGAEILQWAMMGWDDGNRTPVRVDTFRMLGNPNAPEAVEALKINGYNYAERDKFPIMQAGFIEAVYGAIETYDGMVVGANPHFSLEMVHRTARRLGVQRPKTRIRGIDLSSLGVPLNVAGKISGIRLADLAALVGREQKKPCESKDIVELSCDVFEKLFELYYGALRG